MNDAWITGGSAHSGPAAVNERASVLEQADVVYGRSVIVRDSPHSANLGRL